MDVSAATWIASENQRLRIQLGDTATVTLPNAVPLYVTWDPYDYGFSPPTPLPPQGVTGPADAVQFRQPRDGARIRASLQAKAKSLRAATASEQLTAANRASEYMGGPLIGMLLAFLAVVLAPALAQVLAIN